MKTLYFLFLITFTGIIYANKHDVKVDLEQVPDGYELYITNNEIYPVSLILSFELTNLSRAEKHDTVYTIDGNTSKTLLTSLKIINPQKKYGLGYSYKLGMGVHNNTKQVADFEYYLPYENAKSFIVAQGYNGKASHKNLNALDFSMPVGTKITAIRNGLVVKVIDSNSKNCASSDCAKYNNSIVVMHNDGTFAAYVHIKKNGANVKVGDKVLQGQYIALSGNVGWTSGPHLHLVIYNQNISEVNTLKTLFKTGDGNKSEKLIEGQSYIRNYK